MRQFEKKKKTDVAVCGLLENYLFYVMQYSGSLDMTDFAGMKSPWPIIELMSEQISHRLLWSYLHGLQVYC